MNNLLALFRISNFVNKLGNLLIYILIALAVVICVVIMAKYPASRRILFYIISCLVIFVGVYSTGSFIHELNMKGYVNGDIQLINSITKNNFYWSSNSIVFNYDENLNVYTFENNFVPTEFDGEHNLYNVEFNDYLLFDSKITSGAISSIVNMDFRDTNGEIVDSGDMSIIIKYLSDRTTLKLSVKDKTHASYLEKYFKDYSFKINVYLREI